MATTQCGFCASDLGYYDGPNGKPRCLNCFMEQPDQPSSAEAKTTEPNRDFKDKAVAPPEPLTSTSGKAAKGKSTAGTATE